MKKIIVLFAFLSVSSSSVSLLAQGFEVVDWEARVSNLQKVVIKMQSIDLEKQDATVLEVMLDLLKSQVMFMHDGLREQTARLANKGTISWGRATEEFQKSIGPAEDLVPKLQGIIRRKNNPQ